MNATCEHQYVSTTRKRSVTVQGMFGGLLALSGLFLLLMNPVLGALLLIAGVLIGMIGRTKTVILCAKCGAEAPHQP